MGLGDTTRRVVVQFIAEDVNTGSVATGIKSQLAAVAVVAAGAAAAIKFVGDETERLDDIAKDAQKSGLGFTAYQQLSHVSKLAGTDVKALAKATVTLEKNLLTIARGSGKEAADALADLGLAQDDLAGLGVTERLGVFAKALGEVEDETTRAALAEQLMGKQGRQLIPLFNAGADAIDEMVASTGHIFTREDLAKAEAYQDSLTELDKVASDTAGTLALAVAPALTEIAGEFTDAGKEAGSLLPVVTKLLSSIAKGLGPPIKLVTFFADQLGTVGRVVDLVGGKLGRATDRVTEFAGGVADAVSESALGDFARGAVEGLDELTGETDGLTESVKDLIPWSDELGRSWDEVARAITGAEVAGAEFSGIKDIQDGIGALVKLGKELGAEAEDRAAHSMETAAGVSFEADETQRLAELMIAQGVEQDQVNGLLRDALVLRRDALVLAGEENKVIAANHKLAIFDAKIAAEAAKPKGGGGRGPSRADRVRAAGGGAVQDLEHMAELQATIATTAGEIFEAEDAARQARIAGLDLEREALEVTRARGAVARAELATELAAVDQQAGLIVLQGRVAAREQEAAAVEELRTLEQARNASRSEEAGRVIDLETFRLEAMASQLEAQGQLGAAFDLRQQQREREAEFAAVQFAAREEELALHPPETELERIEQMDAALQIAHDRELARIQQDGAARQAHATELDRLAKDEAKRKKTAIAQTVAVAGATRSIMTQGQAFAGKVLDAAGVDGEKRQRLDMKIAGVSALATGALEIVKAVAAGASLNPVQAAAHGAAAAFAIGSGVALLAGQIPAGGGASAAGAAPEPERPEREFTEAARIPDSVPAADREPSQASGGAGAQDRGGFVINGDFTINASGAVDEDFVETMATELDNLSFKRGA